MTTDRRGIDSYDKRKDAADCAKGKHLWLVNRIEPRELQQHENLHFKVYGRCALCSQAGESDLMTREELPVNEALFTTLQAVRLKNAMNVQKLDFK